MNALYAACLKGYRVFRKDRNGAIALIFALVLPLLMASIGISLEMAQAYLVRARLGTALDAAALAAASVSCNENDDMRETLEKFFAANYPPNKIGTTYDLEAVPNEDGSEITVSAYADLKTSFLATLGLKNITVYEKSVVRCEVRGIEAILVLDVTGSMSTNNNIATLRTAATNFVTTMFDRTTEPEYVKIGLVPFSTSVNVGPYGLGRTLTNATYAGGRKFVNNPGNYSYSTTTTTQWGGCILESPPYATPMDTQNHQGPWDMYRYYTCTTQNGRKTCDYSKPNTICPKSPVVPLTNNETTLKNAISALKADGNTLSNVGMVWGYRLISPEFPFLEGADWDDLKWRKAVILMTDGDNQNYTAYSAYGPSNTVTNTQLNQRLETTCTNMKNDGILIYTIVFTSGVNATTKGYFQRCASSVDKYYYAPTQTDLLKVFNKIANELSNLHLKE